MGFTAAQIADQIEARIRANRLLNLNVAWDDEFIYPNYDGLSILNVVQSVKSLLGADAEAPLDDLVWHGHSLAGEVERVVLFLTDGLGYKLLQELCEEDDEIKSTVNDLTDGRGPVPLTSTAPSTTAVALPTLWSANYPGTHGMIGTTMFMQQFVTIGNMLQFKPQFGDIKPGAFEDWGVPPDTFIPVPTISEQLAAVDVPVHLLLDKNLMGTGLSRIMHRGVQRHHIHTGTLDVWLRLEDVLKETAGQRCHVNVYWPVVDMLSHVYGSHSRYVRNEVKTQLRAMRDVLEIESVRDGRTLFMIIADHGHYDAPTILYDENRTVPEHVGMRFFGGDVRFTHLFLQRSKAEQAVEWLCREQGEYLAVVPTHEALKAGLFGNGELHPEVTNRMGDVLVFSRQGCRFYDPRPKKPVSLHGGLGEREMLVPFMWKRF